MNHDDMEYSNERKFLEAQIKRLMQEEVFSVDANGEKKYFYFDTSNGRLYFKSDIRGKRMEITNARETLIAIINEAEQHTMLLEDTKFHRKSIENIHNWKLDKDFL